MTTSKKAKAQNVSVGVRELRQSASQILDQVKEGISVEITEHGAELETERKFNKIQVLTWETCLLRTLGVYSRILQEIP